MFSINVFNKVHTKLIILLRYFSRNPEISWPHPHEQKKRCDITQRNTLLIITKLNFFWTIRRNFQKQYKLMIFLLITHFTCSNTQNKTASFQLTWSELKLLAS